MVEKEAAIVRQRRGKRFSAATTDELLEAVFSVWSERK
jgi:hypothetical protein